MSTPVPSAQETIEEFSFSIDDIRDFVFASKKRALDDTQLKVILKNKINRIKSSFNNLISHFQVDSETRSKLLFESIPKLTDVCNNIDHTSFELIWLELDAMINSFAASLIGIHSKGDIWSVQGSATLLVNIISGIPQVDHLPTLVGRSIEDPEYLDHWRVTFNYLQFTAATYFGVIYAVKTVNLSDIITWSNQGFYYFSLLDNYFLSFEWEKIAQVHKHQPENFFILTNTVASTFINFVEYILILLKRFGSNWPSEINTQGLFEDRSFDGLISYIDHLKTYVLNAIQKVNELYSTGMWSANDNPTQSEPYKQLLEQVTLYDYYLAFVEALKTADPSLPKPRSIESGIEKLTKALDLNEWVLQNIESQFGDRTSLLQSYLGSEFADTLEQRLELLALNSIFVNNPSLFQSDNEKYGWAFANADPQQYADLLLKKLLVGIFLAAKFDLKDKFPELFDEVIRLKELLQFRPRDFTTLIILELIIGFFFKNLEIPTSDQVFISINKNGLISGGDYHLLNEFQEYIDYLIPALHGEPSNLSEVLIDRKTLINSFDSITWLTPDFDHVFKSQIKIPIFFLPFNRAVDGIINIKS